ncbi:MAG: SprT-like domain-containing protein [Cyclobacteriaceae bacterium]
MKANSKESVYTVLDSFLSSEEMSVWCTDLWNEYPFLFILTKDRKSKLGDYRFDRRKKKHTITLNKTLSPHQFLITYLHEVAHRITQEIHKGRVAPHGKEWKGIFSSLLLKSVTFDYFPEDLVLIIKKHALNPKASCSADQALSLALKEKVDNNQLLLADIQEGNDFIFRNKIYTKLKKRRTRSLCLDKASKRQYLISEIAPISLE